MAGGPDFDLAGTTKKRVAGGPDFDLAGTSNKRVPRPLRFLAGGRASDLSDVTKERGAPPFDF